MNLDFANTLIQRRVEAAMTSTVSVLRGTLGQLDEDTLLVSGIVNPTTIYTGKAHVHNVNGAGALNLGQGEIDVRTCTISIPISAPLPRRDDLVHIDVDGDPDLPGRTFRVTDVNTGGLLNAFHSMICQGWNDSRYWTG